MALPVPVEYFLAFSYNAPDGVNVGPTLVGLSAVGYTIINPYDIGMKHSEGAIPGGQGAQIVTDNKAAANDLRVVGQATDSNPEDLQAALSLQNTKLQASRINPAVGALADSFLYVGVYDGAAMQLFRRYCRFVNASMPIKRKTHMQATEMIELLFRSHDPALYSGAVNSQVITVTSGTGSEAITPAGNMATGRALVEITKNGADNPTNVTITNLAGDSFTITGSLTTASDKWVVDLYYGKAWLDPATGSNSDISGLVSGQFFNTAVTADTIQVADTASSDFTVTFKWLDRYH